MEKIGKLIKSDGFQQSVVMTGGNLAGTAISAMALIMVSRALGPEEFGIFSTGFSLSLFLTRILDLGFGLSLQRQISQEKGGSATSRLHNGIQAVMLFRLGLGLLCGVAAFTLGPWLATTIFHLDEPQVIVMSLSLCGITLGFDYVVMILQAEEKFIVSSLLAMAQGSIKLLSALLMGFGGWLTAATALGFYLIAPIVGIFAGIKTYWRQWLQPPIRTGEDLQILAKTARWLSISLLSAAAAEHLDVLMIQSFLSTYETGLFSAAGRIAMFIGLIGVSLATVLSIRVAKYHQPKHLKKYLKKAIILAMVSAGLCLLVIPFNQWLLRFTVGVSYLSVSSVLTLIIIATAIATATAPYQSLFYLFDRPIYYTYSGLILLVSLIAGDWWLIPRFGLAGAAYARILSRILVLGFTLWYARRGYREHILAYAKTE